MVVFSQVWFKMPWKGGIRMQLTSQSARSRSPRHGLVSLHGQQEPQQLQGAVAPALEADPTPSSSNRRSPWPAPYFADIPVRDKATKQETMANIPFLLPHETLDVIAQANPETIEAFVAANIQEPQLKATAAEWAEMFQQSMNNIIPLDLHGDGVPFCSQT